MELWLWLTGTEEGVDQTWCSEVEKWRIKVPVSQPQSQESYRANMGSIANPLQGRLLSSLKELVVSSWKVCLQDWEVGKRGAYVSSAARIGMGRMERGGQAER